MRKLMFVALFLTFGGSLSAQEAPKAEVYGGYSFANVVLLGGARLNSTTTLFFPLPPGFPSRFSSSDFAFALALGGGVDYRLRDRWAWRVQTDYLQSGFFSRTENSFRLSTGIVFHFGK